MRRNTVDKNQNKERKNWIDAIARGEPITVTTEHDRSDAGHVAWRADARGMALDWWIQELENPALRAALTRSSCRLSGRRD